MKKKWLILLASLGVILLASSVGVTTASFVDLEISSGNTFEAWTSILWRQTTQADFEAGVLNNVDTSSSPGDVKLGSVSEEPTTSMGSEESWYYISWSRRAPVTISNPGSGLTDFQVKVDVTYDADMQPDFDDIRFVDSDDSTELSHWRESYTASTSATFWVKVPSIPSGNKTIYMYYGNATASSASDGDATFVFFDDFESGNLDKWTIVTDTFWSVATDQKHSGTYSLKAGATSSSDKYIVATGVNESDLVYESWWYVTATSPDICSQFRASPTTPYNDYHINWEGQWTIAKLVGGSWTSLNAVSGTLPTNTWFETTIIIKESPGQMRFLKDDVQINPASGWLNVGTDHISGTVGHRAWTANNNWWIDDVRARKYASPEPTTTLGSEDGWSRWAPVTINNPGSGLTDFQVKVDVAYDADMQPDFDDIRFRDSDDSTSLSHWRESYTASTSATFWVKVPSIPSGNKTIYMYYGNATASSASDGDATFVFFDDFDNASLGADWTFSQVGGAIGFYAESGTVIRLTGTDTGDLWDSSDKFLFLSVSGNYDNVLIESYTPAWGGAHGMWSKMGGVQLRQSVDAGSKNRIMSPVFSAVGATNSYRLTTGESTDEQTTTTSPKYNRVNRTGGTSRAWYSTDGITWTELGSQISFTGGLTDPVCLGIHLAGLSSAEHWVEVDWFRVRKYPAPSTYVSPGTIASDVLDTGVTGARWDALFWSETVEDSTTDITFEVRASDTWFDKGDAMPDWTDLGTTNSPITSGLPSGRYKQWRATLTTSDTSKASVLHEVRVYYY